jgi:CheY-like chemotaxis protein
MKKKSAIKREYMPYGKVLVVDDMPSNLDIMQLLLKPYGLKVDTADDGHGAVEKAKNGNTYNIVFMDHMMPEMDGIEAAKKMRELGYTQPIVALTGNAEAGQSELFMANGFDAFISKPIDVRQLDSVLLKFVKPAQPPEYTETAELQKGEAEYVEEEAALLTIHPHLAEIFVQDLSRTIGVLEKIHEKCGHYEEEDIRLYTINVHAMKSALANMGEKELSAVAYKLEQAGRAKDTVVMAEETQVFLEKLRMVVDKLKPMQENKETTDIESSNEDLAYLREALLTVKNACDGYDRKTAKDTIAALRQRKWPLKTKELLGTMAEHLLNGDFEEVSKIAEELNNK